MANQKNWREKCFNNLFSVSIQFKVWEYYLSTKAVRRQYSPVWKVKIYSGTDNKKTTKRQLELHMYMVYVRCIKCSLESNLSHF